MLICLVYQRYKYDEWSAPLDAYILSVYFGEVRMDADYPILARHLTSLLVYFHLSFCDMCDATQICFLEFFSISVFRNLFSAVFKV